MTSEPDTPPEEPGEVPGENPGEQPAQQPAQPAPSSPGHVDGPDQPEPPELDIEAEFAAIVAAWENDGGTDGGSADGTATDPVARWPVSEDVPGEEEKARDETGPSVAAPPERDAPTVWRQGPDPLAEPVPMSAPDGRGGTEAEEEFVPPEPLPLGRGDFWLRAAWVSVFGGPLFLIACLLLMPKPLPNWTIAIGVGGFVGGFAMLVARMPVHRDEDDDGAVV